MIDKLALSAALRLSAYENMPEVDVMKYSIKVILTNVITFILMIIFGVIFDNVLDVIVAAASFSLLRTFSGGYHIKSAELCIIFSNLLVVSIANLSYAFNNYHTLIVFLALIMVAIFAPSRIKHHSIIDKKYHIVFKLISLVIVVGGFFINNITIQTSFLIQSLTLIHLRGGELIEKSNE